METPYKTTACVEVYDEAIAILEDLKDKNIVEDIMNAGIEI